jgi:t-SNARE complex subunit (syntaxin)
LSNYEENAISNAIIEEMSKVFEMKFNDMKNELDKYSSFISRVNHPSKNILYGISKAVFFKFRLGKYQDEYFAQLNTPNPVFLKKIDNLVENYIWDWESVFEKNKIVY